MSMTAAAVVLVKLMDEQERHKHSAITSERFVSYTHNDKHDTSTYISCINCTRFLSLLILLPYNFFSFQLESNSRKPTNQFVVHLARNEFYYTLDS